MKHDFYLSKIRNQNLVLELQSNYVILLTKKNWLVNKPEFLHHNPVCSYALFIILNAFLELFNGNVLQSPKSFLNDFSVLVFRLNCDSIEINNFAAAFSARQNRPIQHRDFLYSFLLIKNFNFPLEVLSNIFDLLSVLILFLVFLFVILVPFFLENIGASVLLIKSLHFFVKTFVYHIVRIRKAFVYLGLYLL